MTTRGKPSLLLTLCISLSCGAPCFGQNVKESVVKISSSISLPNPLRPWEVARPRDASGSGVVIKDQRILTSSHVVAHAQQIYVQPYNSPRKLAAHVEFLSDECDLATLRLDDAADEVALKPLPLSDTPPDLQTKVSVMGYPVGGENLSVTEGVLSRIECTFYRCCCIIHCRFSLRALRFQIDAAINPGNSGGPAIVNGRVIGIVFGNLPARQNIGYLVPSEVITRFLDDCLADGHYDGFARLELSESALENPSLREYLGVKNDQGGVVVNRVFQPDISPELLASGDVITTCEGAALDELGMVSITDNVKVHWSYLLSKRHPGDKVRLSVLRAATKLEVTVPTASLRGNMLVHRTEKKRPSYFVYGGVVFVPVTAEMMLRLPSEVGSLLVNSLLADRLPEYQKEPTDEVVVRCDPMLPHKLNKGYTSDFLPVVTHVNDTPVKNLRHLVELVKGVKGEFVVFRFENDKKERIVLDRKLVEKHQAEILQNNNVSSACSDDLKDIWP